MSSTVPVQPLSIATEIEPGHSLWSDAWHRLRRNRLAVFGGGVLLTLAVVCLVGPWFSHYTYDAQELGNAFAPPDSTHWLGTDQHGRDLLVRILYGGRISLGVGLCATLVALSIGVVYGAISGYAGRKTDAVMMRFVDILYALPFTIFVILLMVFFGRNIVLLFVATVLAIIGVACNTAHGFGKDVKNAGQGIEDGTK